MTDFLWELSGGLFFVSRDAAPPVLPQKDLIILPLYYLALLFANDHAEAWAYREERITADGGRIRDCIQVMERLIFSFSPATIGFIVRGGLRAFNTVGRAFLAEIAPKVKSSDRSCY
jgi:hypothetical protein